MVARFDPYTILMLITLIILIIANYLLLYISYIKKKYAITYALSISFILLFMISYLTLNLKLKPDQSINFIFVLSFLYISLVLMYKYNISDTIIYIVDAILTILGIAFVLLYLKPTLPSFLQSAREQQQPRRYPAVYSNPRLGG